ncbi:MAG TPA: Smr/MutS family protein [Burkholderiales bacterium]|nr:Smr/MutS family protein [Burkholderiales bacterium]
MKRPAHTHGSDDDAALFRDAVRDVAPLPASGRVLHPPVRQRALPYQSMRAEREALAASLGGAPDWDIDLETGEESIFVRAGVPAQALRKLRRGHWVIQRQLDLHGATSAEAHALLADFLADCVRRGLRCVRIIHGKGLRSKNREPVLKRKVAGWLARRDEILAFCEARREDGGSGAVVVLLKGAKRQS